MIKALFSFLASLIVLSLAPICFSQSSPIKITSPSWSETMAAGSSYDIQWTASPEAVKFKLQYSLDNGLSWIPIQRPRTFITGRSYNWTVPAPSGNKTDCFLKLVGYNASGVKVGSDKSDACFKVEIVKLTYPTLPDFLSSLGKVTITWTINSTKTPVAETILYYTKNAGLTWKKIRTFEGDPNPRSFEWTIPLVKQLEPLCKIKVVLKDANGNNLGSDISDDSFTISPNLSGFGTAVIDGVMNPEEWSGAGKLDYLANIPWHDGGGTTPAALFVMNDETNIYIALKIVKFAARGAGAFFEFDNNHNGVWPEEGDDVFGVNTDTFSPATFIDAFRTAQPPCPRGFCSPFDTDFGGTADGASAATNDDEFTYIEISHPLRSGDSLHDFSLNSGDVVGFHHRLTLWSLDLPCNYDYKCYAETEFPPKRFFGDIVIQGRP